PIDLFLFFVQRPDGFVEIHGILPCPDGAVLLSYNGSKIHARPNSGLEAIFGCWGWNSRRAASSVCFKS
ncbi:MAG: hypothetical protein ACP5U2_09085, partial [Bryobacteraceae bacterium]